MRGLHLLYLSVIALLCSGCMESADVQATPSQSVGTRIEKPTEESLKAHLGAVVTIEGTFSSDKAGDVVWTPQLGVLFHQTCMAFPEGCDIPDEGTPIKVTGTLTERPYEFYHYELKNAEYIELSSPAATRKTTVPGPEP
jgi:hypothetical protein